MRNFKKIIGLCSTLAIFLSFSLATLVCAEAAIADTEEKITVEEIASADVPILMYHHLDSIADKNTIVTRETFEKYIKALVDNGYTGVSFEQLVNYVENDGELPQKPIVITFDDGYLSNYEFAYPVLKKYNIKATIFIIGISVGKDTYRNTENSDYPIIPHFNYAQANEMVESGIISIQSHSYDMHQIELYEKLLNREYRHGVLPCEGESEEEYTANFREDYIRSKTELETAVKGKSIAYAYPYGICTELSERLLQEMGVKVTLTSNYGSNIIIKGKPESLYLLNRIAVNNIPAEELLKNLEKCQ